MSGNPAVSAKAFEWGRMMFAPNCEMLLSKNPAEFTQQLCLASVPSQDSPDKSRRLAAKGKFLGRRPLSSVATIVTSDTILRWHRRLIAA